LVGRPVGGGAPGSAGEVGPNEFRGAVRLQAEGDKGKREDTTGTK